MNLKQHPRTQWWPPVAGLALVVCVLFLANCGASTEVSSNPPTGRVNVSISDPPPCRFPAGDFRSVFVSIRSVQAHISTTASENSGGWVELAPQLAQNPIQVDLLALPSNGCTLASLGSNPSLPVGDYQQIRLILVSNTPGGNDPRPASNACGSQGFNCVVLSDNSVHRIDLNSQDITGIKIPPGQVVGGPIRVADGQTVDLNIDFNVCASLIRLPGNRWRMRPTLTAGQVSTTASAALGGQVVDAATMQPIAGGSALVALEQVDNTGTVHIIMEAMTDSNGNFSFCPVPMGMFDVVAVATGQNNTAYGPTAVLNVSTGAALGRIPLIAESGMTPLGPATMQGTVTASSGTAPNTTGVDVNVGLFALQAITVGMGTRDLAIPLLGNSDRSAATMTGATCPAGTNCANYSLIVPAQNPSFGTFASGGTMFSTPATGDVLYKVQGRASMVMSTTAICSPSTQTTDKDAADMPLKVTGGMTTMVKRLDFTGCM
jgi:hypothetical protein